VASSMSAGQLADRLGARPAVTVSMLAVLALLGAFAALPYLPEEMRLPALLVTFALQGYTGWGFWIAHCSHMAHLAPSSVPVAISLDMAALNIGMALAAGLGGMAVDSWGANILALAGVPAVVAALLIWVALPEPRAETAKAGAGGEP